MWWVILLLAQSAAGSDAASDQRRVRAELEFDQHWEAWLLAEHGCPNVRPAGVVVKELRRADCVQAPVLRMEERKKWLRLLPKIAPELFKGRKTERTQNIPAGS